MTVNATPAQIARQNMIEGQLRPNKVIDEALLVVVARTPREEFVPQDRTQVAYIDEAIALGDGRYLMEPMVLARLVQALELKPSDIVLDIGAGTGYAAALLSGLAGTVVALEEDRQLSLVATTKLQKIGCDNVVVIENPLQDGYPQQAPYDAILIEGSVDAVPDGLLSQMAEGGRLVAVVAGRGGMGQAKLWRKVNGQICEAALFDAGIPSLKAFARKPAFAF